MDSICGKICGGNGRFFYFSDGDKLDSCYILKRRYTVLKNNSSVLFIECTEMNCKHQMQMACVFQFSWTRWDGTWVL